MIESMRRAVGHIVELLVIKSPQYSYPVVAVCIAYAVYQLFKYTHMYSKEVYDKCGVTPACNG